VISALEVRKKIARDHDMPYAGLELDEAPMLSEMEQSDQRAPNPWYACDLEHVGLRAPVLYKL
jgi:hypothetical protein